MTESHPERPAFIFGYSLILPAAWISICTVLYLIAPGQRLGTVGSSLMFMGVASLIGWLFAKRHHRQFTEKEYWRIILYCLLWALSLEYFVIFAVIVLPQLEAGQVDIKLLSIVIPITTVLDAALIWLAFRQAGRRTIDYYLSRTATPT